MLKESAAALGARFPTPSSMSPRPELQPSNDDDANDDDSDVNDAHDEDEEEDANDVG